MRIFKVFLILLLVFMFVSGLMVLMTQTTTLAQQTNSTAQPWPQYRHDQRNTGAVNSYGPSLKEPLWVVEMGGVHPGRSAPVVADDKVFVTPRMILPKAFSVDGDLIWEGLPTGLVMTTLNVDPGLGVAVYADSTLGQIGQVYCASVSNGDILWNASLGNLSYTLASPTIDPVEKKVVVNMFMMLSTQTQYTVALDLETGDELWKAGPWDDASISPSGGSTSTPSIYGGRVYFGAQDGKVYSLSLEDGSEVWSYRTGASIGGAVTVGTNGLVYVGSHDGYFRAFDAANGTLVWQYECGIFEGDSVYGCALDETRGLVIVPQVNGTISACDWNTGEEVWRSKLPDWSGGNYHAGSEPGDTTGATEGQFCPGTSLPTISILDGKVFIQGVNNSYQGWGHEGIFCFDIDEGTMMDWYIYPGGAYVAPRETGKGLVSPSTSIADGRLYAVSYNRKDVYCFCLSTPIAAFAYSPANPIIDEAVTFNASASLRARGTIVSYVWDFGDGSTGTGVAVNHAYTTEGNYTVWLNVTDSEGPWDTESKSITVVVSAPTPGTEFPWFWIGVGVVVVIVAAVVIVVVRKRFR